MKSLLCFGAHADDIEFGCMGTVIQHLKKGWHVRFVILTNGENGFKLGQATPEERVQIRKAEQMEVARRLGLDSVLFLDYRDGFLEYTEELRCRIVEILKRYRPQRVFSFDPANREYDNLNLFHRDHRIAAEAVFDACFAAKNLWMYPGEAHRIEEIYFFGSQKPDHFVDIGDVIEAKIELLACHKSQFTDFNRVAKFVRGKMSQSHQDYEYAESFRVLRIEQIT